MSLQNWLPLVLERTKTLPHLLGLSRHAASAFDEMQESSFALLTLMLYNINTSQATKGPLAGLKEAVVAKSGEILQSILGFIENATYKCEQASGENASECLSVLIDVPAIHALILSD